MAYGQLTIVAPKDRARDPKAQREAGEGNRRGDDDGGHLIAVRFGGSPTGENLFPQNLHLNRGAYKRLERIWAEELEKNNQVYVCIYVSSAAQGNRQDAVYGSYTIVRPDGSRVTEGFSFANESNETQSSWEEENIRED